MRPQHLESLRESRRIVGLAQLLVPGLGMLLAFGLGAPTGDVVLLALFTWFWLASGVVGLTKRVLSLRLETLEARLASADAVEAPTDGGPGSEGSEEPSSSADVDETAQSDTAPTLRLWPLGLRALFAPVLAFLLPWANRQFVGWPPFQNESATRDWTYAGVLAALAILASLFARFLSESRADAESKTFPEAPGLAAWFGASAWTALLLAVLYVARPYAPWIHASIPFHILAGLVLLASVEVLGHILVASRSLGRGTRRATGRTPGSEILSLRFLASRWNPVASLFHTLTESFGLDLRGAWALTFMRRALGPLVLGLALCGWIATSFVMIDTHERGVLERFGRRAADAQPMEPGLHLVWPWPVSKVRRVATDRVVSMPIGYRGMDREAPLLWDTEHAEEEYLLLCGSKDSLVTVNAVLQYRPADPVAYLYNNQNPVEALERIADRALLNHTSNRALDDVLTDNLGTLGQSIETRVREDADAMGLGIEVVAFELLSLHPPRAVVPDYHDVVGAEVERKTLPLLALEERASQVPNARGEAALRVARARANGIALMNRERGASIVIQEILENGPENLEPFIDHLKLEKELRDMRNRPITFVDHRLNEDGLTLIIIR